MRDLILALESSCDDTSICLLKDKNIVFEKTISNSDSVEKFGGVYPEYVARSHPNSFFELFNEIAIIHPDWKDRVKRIAFTSEPGFIGSLVISKIIASTIALDIFNSSNAIELKHIPKFYDTKKLSLLKVNHLDGHCFSAFIEKKQAFPFIAAIISGGHTQIYYIESFFSKILLSSTRDDSIGEAYDKVGRLLKVPYPWGQNIDNMVGDTENMKKFDFKSPLLEDGSFSFSGIKSKVAQIIEKMPKNELEEKKSEILCEFQHACQNAIYNRMLQIAKEKGCETIAIGGGVASNSLLRKKLRALSNDGYDIHIPEKNHCVDNATMIAWAVKVSIESYLKTRK